MEDRHRKGRDAHAAPYNPARGEQHGRYTHPERTARGERGGRAKLTEAQVRDIRARYAAGGVTSYQLAAEYGIARKNINAVVNRQTWAHVE